VRTMASHQDDSPAIPAEGRGRLTFKTRTVPAFGTRSANENRLEDPPEDVRGRPRLSPTSAPAFIIFVMGITASPNIFGHSGPFPAREDAMDPDFFEVVMGADGTLKCFPVTEQAHAEVTISSEKRARERFPGLNGSYVAPAIERRAFRPFPGTSRPAIATAEI
jgi:hypothetical protein